MIPLPGFKDLEIRWIAIKGRGFLLYGFILYSNADLQIIKFMERSLPFLDIWSGPEAAIFLIEPPSEEWLRYMASQPDHPWHLFESDTEEGKVNADANYDVLMRHADRILLDTGDDEQLLLASVVRPSYAIPYDRLEVERVRQHFRLRANQYPCVIFFEDLYASDFDHIPMPRFPDIQDVRYWFQELFESTVFEGLLNRARRKVTGQGARHA
jgi:hypothetical protein